MTRREDREDVSQQEAHLRACKDDLADALTALADEATRAAKAARRAGRKAVDLTDVHAEHRAVARTEEAVDMAVNDIATALGADA